MGVGSGCATGGELAAAAGGFGAAEFASVELTLAEGRESVCAGEGEAEFSTCGTLVSERNTLSPRARFKTFPASQPATSPKTTINRVTASLPAVPFRQLEAAPDPVRIKDSLGSRSTMLGDCS